MHFFFFIGWLAIGKARITLGWKMKEERSFGRIDKEIPSNRYSPDVINKLFISGSDWCSISKKGKTWLLPFLLRRLDGCSFGAIGTNLQV